MSGFFLCLDQILKYLARTNSDFSFYIWKNWIGWEYLANPGIAFSLPVPNWLVVLVTPFILLGIILWFFKKSKVVSCQLSVVLILAGALSNYIDRILFGVTIDYFRILTGVINLADVMIVGGVGLLLVKSYKVKK